MTEKRKHSRSRSSEISPYKKSRKSNEEKKRLSEQKRRKNDLQIKINKKNGTYLHPYDIKYDPYAMTVYQEGTDAKNVIERQRSFDNKLDHEDRKLAGLTFGGTRKKRKRRSYKKNKNIF